jgi:hypothetical protein
MNLNTASRRSVAGMVLAALVVASLAPAAYAGHGQGWGKVKKYRRYEQAPRVVERRTYGLPPVVEIRRSSSSVVPAIVGFIGGLALGATLGSSGAYAEPGAGCCEPEPAYFYDDPYCHERFATLEVYLVHVRHHPHHPSIVRVMDVHGAHCVRQLHWHDGRWQDWGDYREDPDDDWEE